jgi:hypothetical protein
METQLRILNISKSVGKFHPKYFNKNWQVLSIFGGILCAVFRKGFHSTFRNTLKHKSLQRNTQAYRRARINGATTLSLTINEMTHTA